MKCPYCKKELAIDTTVKRVGIKVRKYICKSCEIKFERHSLYNNLGLIKEDTLIEDGFKKSW